MSLLMNALKKAESAKSAGELDAAQSTAVPPTAASVGTRDMVKELGLDPPPVGRSRSARIEPDAAVQFTAPAVESISSLGLELEPEAAVPNRPSSEDVMPASRGSTTPVLSSVDAAQSVRNVFNAKKTPSVGKGLSDGNSRKPFFVLVGSCLLAGAGYAVYIWQQMQPPSRAALAVRNLPPAVQAPAQHTGSTVASPSAPVTGQADPAADKEPSPGEETLERTPRAASGDTGAGRVNPQAVPPGRENAPKLPDARDTREMRRDAARADGGTAVDTPANLQITRSAGSATVNPDIAEGYAALQRGNLEGATQAYERALRADSASRDALLGLATIQLRLNRNDVAEATFRRVLRLHPQDAYAAAQLAALQSGTDPVGALSQVNSLIARESDRTDAGNGALPFIQGNQLAAQGRWNEAQQAYFNAHRADPNNPDYCYNLAVSLDRIHESRLARDFYAKSLELARARPAGFDTSRAQTRLGQLSDTAK